MDNQIHNQLQSIVMRKQILTKHHPAYCAQRSQLPDRRVLSAIIAFLLACVLAPPSVFADKAGDDFNLGVGLYRTQRYELAVDTFHQFLKEFPKHPRANLARLYFALSLDSLEKYAPARDQFIMFLQAEPEGRNAAEARYRLGECSYYLGDYPAAIEQLSAYLEKHPSHSRG